MDGVIVEGVDNVGPGMPGMVGFIGIRWPESGV